MEGLKFLHREKVVRNQLCPFSIYTHVYTNHSNQRMVLRVEQTLDKIAASQTGDWRNQVAVAQVPLNRVLRLSSNQFIVIKTEQARGVLFSNYF